MWLREKLQEMKTECGRKQVQQEDKKKPSSANDNTAKKKKKNECIFFSQFKLEIVFLHSKNAKQHEHNHSVAGFIYLFICIFWPKP